MKHASARDVSPESFETRYRCNSDPWNYSASPYERGKYATTLDALGRPHYRAAFEPACSVGELTALLSTRCEGVLAIDVSATAVRRARERNADCAGVQVLCRDVRTFMPCADFDLVLFSELGYYFDVAALQLIARRFASCLLPGGEFVAVHWRGHSADHVLHGDEVHFALQQCLPLTHCFSARYPGFGIDSWLRT